MSNRLRAAFALIPLISIASAEVLETFEGDGFGDWVAEGEAFGLAPVHGKIDGMEGELKGYSQKSFACSAHGGNASKGTLTSQPIKVTDIYLAFLVAGGSEKGKTAVQLLLGDEIVRESVGNNSLTCQQTAWDVRDLRGKDVRIRLVDDAGGEWGWIAADQFQFANWHKPKNPPQHIEAEKKGEQTSEIVGLTIPKGSSAKIVADNAKHGIYSPTALAFDEKGALYLSETHRFRHGVEDNRNHLYWLMEDAAAQTTDDRRKMHDKWSNKLSHEYMTEKSEIIRRLSDQDDEGNFTKANIYADKFNDVLDGTAAGVFAYEGSVYFANIPKIYRLKDTDGDGAADDRIVIQDGMGVRVSFSGHDLNGFKLGPDGRIYSTIGDRGFSFTTLKGVTYKYPNQGAVFRFDPDGSNFEAIHFGLRNPKELAFDNHGNLFSVDNNSDQGDKARVVYIVEGADSGWRMGHQLMHSFHRQIGMEKRPPSRWMNEKWWETQNDAQPASILPPVSYVTSGPSGLVYHPGTGFLESEVGRFLVCDYRGSGANSGVWSFAVEEKGAGMEMTNAELLIGGIAPTDVTYSWDGDLYISDFIGGWESHNDGRVVRVSADNKYLAKEAEEVASLVAKGFDSLSTDELVKLVSHPDQRVRIRAHLALTRKSDGLAALEKLARSGEGLARLHGVWGLGVIARRGAAALPDGAVSMPVASMDAATNALVDLLGEKDAEVRAQVIKVLSETGVKADRIDFDKLISDSSDRVRMFAAITAAKIEAKSAIPAVTKMVEATAGNDPYLRHAGAYAMSKLMSSEELAKLNGTNTPVPVRLTAVVALGHQMSPLAQAFLADPDSRVLQEAIYVIHDNRIEEARPAIAKLLDETSKLKLADFTWRRVVNSAFRVGGEENARRVIAAALDENLANEVRYEAIRLMGLWAKPDPVDSTTGTYDPLPERDAALQKTVINARVKELLKIDNKLLEDAIILLNKTKADITVVDEDVLTGMMQNEDLPEAARAALLPRWVERAGDKAPPVLRELVDGVSTLISLAAVDVLIDMKDLKLLEILQAQTKSEDVKRAQNAWLKIAAIQDAKVDKMFVDKLSEMEKTLGISPVALEVLKAAKERSDASVQNALKSYNETIAASDDPLAPYYASLEGGDTTQGFEYFRSHPTAQCMRCHKVGKRGSGEAGPNLQKISKTLDRKHLLEALVVPGARVAPGYGVVSVTLKDGTSTGGVLENTTDKQVELDIAGETKTIKRADIETISDPVSSMPPMGALLKPNEIRDLVQWLSKQ